MKQEKKSTALFAVSLLLLVVAAVILGGGANLLPAGVVQTLEDFTEAHFSESIVAGITLQGIGAAVLALFISWLAVNVVVFASERLPFKARRSKTLSVLVGKILKYVIYVLGAVVALGCVGVDANAIFISAGVLGIVIGFGAQSLIEDAITGLFIILEGEYSIGDIIAVDGFRGEVKNIGLRTVSILDPGGNLLIINNSQIGSVVNLSNVTSAAVVSLPFSYDDPLEKTEAAVQQALAVLPEKYPELFTETPVYKGVEEMNDCNIILMAVAYVPEDKVYDARRAMQREIRLSSEKAGLASPVSA